MLRPALAALVVAILSGCQTHPRSFVDAITPESVTVGITAPNAISGPIVSRKGELDNGHDRFEQIGVSITATYRLKPIKIERPNPMPVAVVRNETRQPAPSPTPNL